MVNDLLFIFLRAKDNDTAIRLQDDLREMPSALFIIKGFQVVVFEIDSAGTGIIQFDEILRVLFLVQYNTSVGTAYLIDYYLPGSGEAAEIIIFYMR